MAAMAVWFPLRLLCWALGLVGAITLLLAAMIGTAGAFPELTSISQTARNVDRSNMPPLERFSARDAPSFRRA
jgi:hypothetical protein